MWEKSCVRAFPATTYPETPLLYFAGNGARPIAVGNGICKTMNTIQAQYETQYNRAFNSIRNRAVITAADLGKNIKVRVIGRGTTITRDNGLVVLLFNTNVMNGSKLAEAVARLKPEAFNAAATDEDTAIQYLRDTQNIGSIPFTIPVTNQQAQQVGQGATIDATVVDVTLKDGTVALGLNFNRVIAAETVGTAASAFDALLADAGVSASESSEDPFGAIAPPANETAAQKKARLKAEALVAA